MGRQAKGVRLIRLDKGQKLAGLATIDIVMEQTGQAGVPTIEPYVESDLAFEDLETQQAPLTERDMDSSENVTEESEE